MRGIRMQSLPWREWVPAALVSALVLVGGARLIELGTQREIAENHAAAAGVAERTASRIEAQLGTLVERAHREAARAAEASMRAPETPESVAPDSEAFWIATDGSIVPAAGNDATAQEALVREWRAHDGDFRVAQVEWLAPLRHGSQWLVAVRAPV